MAASAGRAPSSVLYGIIRLVNLAPSLASLYDLSFEELRQVLQDLNEPTFRAAQVRQWLYRHWCDDPASMTNLPAGLRQDLARQWPGGVVRLVGRASSRDGLTIKYLFELADGESIETVLMRCLDGSEESWAASGPAESQPGPRHALCLSTQVGCAMGCRFCATGQLGLRRNLSRGEILSQVACCARELGAAGEHLTHIVLMGMGEPLANWPATRDALVALVESAGAGFSPRRVTVSTVGLPGGIRRLARSGLRVRLAVSLHAADEDLRRQLLPIAGRIPLDELMAACRAYQAVTGRRISFEYALIAGCNDRPEHAHALVQRLAGLRSHVNLISLNPTPGCELRPSSPAATARFQKLLQEAGVTVSLRRRRGIDIQAGCGQLAAQRAPGSGAWRVVTPVRPGCRSA